MRRTSLFDAIGAVKLRLHELAESHDPSECKAEGLLEGALAGLEAGANILGEDEEPRRRKRTPAPPEGT